MHIENMVIRKFECLLLAVTQERDEMPYVSTKLSHT
jgi:hypothetical protein